MNETVAKFIEEQKKRQEEEQKKQREKHLLNLGLVDNSKTGKKYCSTSVSEAYRKDYGYIYHDENGYFRYDGEPTALDISDEDYEELCKVCPQENKTIICKENVASINKYTNKVSLICVIFNLLVFSSAGEGFHFLTDEVCSIVSCCFFLVAMILNFTSQILDTEKTAKIYTVFGVMSVVSLMVGLILMSIGVWIW